MSPPLKRAGDTIKHSETVTVSQQHVAICMIILPDVADVWFITTGVVPCVVTALIVDFEVGTGVVDWTT